MPKKIDHNSRIGETVNYLTILSVKHIPGSKYQYLCRCKCGNELYIDSWKMYSGYTVSCGCYHKDLLQKYDKPTNKIPAYRSWYGMMRRCYDKKCKGYKWWGGRGITVCERWHTFANFLEDMGHGEKGLSLDRKDNDKGYYKENCRWATRKEQNSNTSRTYKYLIHGVVMTREDIELVFGIKRRSIQYKEAKGKTIYQILNL